MIYFARLWRPPSRGNPVRPAARRCWPQPSALWRASWNLSGCYPLLPNSRLAYTQLDNIFYDFGDVNVVFGNCKKTCEIIEDTVNELSDLKIKPLTIGGEHSLTIGVLNSLTKKYDDLTVVHLDAHRDLADTFIGEPYSHASVMKRVHEMGVKELVQIGIRSASKEEEDFVKNQSNITTFKNNDVFHHLDNIEYYLSLIHI